MPPIGSPPRVLLLANKSKGRVVEALEDLRPWLAERAVVVAEPDLTQLTRETAQRLPAADVAVVLGGDGTLLAQARQVVDLGVPLVGVNFGKLGFMAEFSLEDLRRYWDRLCRGELRRSQRVMIDVRVFRAGSGAGWVLDPWALAEGAGVAGAESSTPQHAPGHAPALCRFESPALNDAVITAGEPFRMIEIELAIDPTDAAPGTSFNGDGVIVSTPSGSTAYNLAAGGPIVNPAADVLGITPICPHSLSLRPLVVNASSCIALRVVRTNPGTTLVLDGQLAEPLEPGDQICVRRHDKPLVLLHHPEFDYWKLLGQKLHWGARPRSE